MARTCQQNGRRQVYSAQFVFISIINKVAKWFQLSSLPATDNLANKDDNLANKVSKRFNQVLRLAGWRSHSALRVSIIKLTDRFQLLPLSASDNLANKVSKCFNQVLWFADEAVVGYLVFRKR